MKSLSLASVHFIMHARSLQEIKLAPEPTAGPASVHLCVCVCWYRRLCSWWSYGCNRIPCMASNRRTVGVPLAQRWSETMRRHGWSWHGLER